MRGSPRFGIGSAFMFPLCAVSGEIGGDLGDETVRGGGSGGKSTRVAKASDITES